jgi:hypothetical protein
MQQVAPRSAGVRAPVGMAPARHASRHSVRLAHRGQRLQTLPVAALEEAETSSTSEEAPIDTAALYKRFDELLETYTTNFKPGDKVRGVEKVKESRRVYNAAGKTPMRLSVAAVQP